MAGDAVALVASIHAHWHTRAFAALSDEAQRHRLFGMDVPFGSPALHAGRQCSLNLHRLCS